jgi:fatty acid desaturase
MSYLVGNVLLGFSSGGWKEQHNVHHAATNVEGRDGDIDLMPLWATVPSDLNVSYYNIQTSGHLFFRNSTRVHRYCAPSYLTSISTGR